ncbi:MAG: transporter [Luteolibacter sp.]
MLPKIFILTIAALPLSAAPLREMSTDRPDTTESPITVDAGHFQIESGFFDYSRDSEDGVKSEVLTYGSLNLKAGLLDNVDLQIVLDSFIEETTTTSGQKDRASGFGDVQTRVKINLRGNDGGDTALALMPFVKIPTGTAVSNGEWEGGLILPFSVSLTDKLGLGLMAESDFVHDGEKYNTEFVHSAVLGYDVSDQIGVFLEYVGVAPTDGDSRYQASANTGLTYSISENLMLDTGVRVGLNDAAEDFGVFVGGSIRY